ncbi:MAG: hypothetical protein ACJAWV_000283 [Flammeovirgaceae bacterium]|jgi:hypothetical protein
MNEIVFKTLIDYLERIPSMQKTISFGDEDGFWWVKFSIDIENEWVYV